MTNQRPGCLTGFLQWLGLAPKPTPKSRHRIVPRPEDPSAPASVTPAPTAPPVAAPAVEPLPYRLRDDFLSLAELSFYHVLKTALSERATICPKVGIAEVLFVARPHENQAYRARIVQKHFDFVLCDVQTLRPLVVIELDDSSHARPDRQARDEFVNEACHAAGLPILHVPVRHTYNTHELAEQLAGYLNGHVAPNPTPAATASAAAPHQVTPSAGSPVCPKCGLPMVLRTARADHSRKFYGCPNYPQCRVILPAQI
jgi:predicted RNA-binding Zn-ribbon protein involved in translation (DUF1610 family)